MITISYDRVIPSQVPEVPNINSLLRVSLMFGTLMTVQSLLFYACGPLLLSSEFRSNEYDGYTQAMIYLQVSVAIELLIFVTRLPDMPFYALAPIGSLLVSVFVANITVTVIVYTGCIGPAVSLSDAMFVWAYDILWFFFLDIVKLPLTRVFDYAFPVERGRGKDLPDSVPEPAPVSDAGSMLSFCLCTDLGYSFVQDSSSLIGGRFVPAGCSDVADAPGGGGHYTDLGDGPKTNQNKSQRGGAYVPPDVV